MQKALDSGVYDEMEISSIEKIKETIKKDLPPGFQRSEFLLEHGFLDFIIHRKELKEKLESSLSDKKLPEKDKDQNADLLKWLKKQQD